MKDLLDPQPDLVEIVEALDVMVKPHYGSKLLAERGDKPHALFHRTAGSNLENLRRRET